MPAQLDVDAAERAWRDDREPDEFAGPASLEPVAASIAVLPLTNESGEASEQYFSDGISEDLINALSQFPGLRVIGRNSAFAFRDSQEDSRSIGAKLGVAHLLEGSLQKSGDMIRVSAELVCSLRQTVASTTPRISR